MEEFLHEMQDTVFRPRKGAHLTVGETPSITIEEAARLTDARTGALSMVFQFEHVDLDHGGDKFQAGSVSVPALREVLTRWQTGIGDHGWNSLYLSNHDQPRALSRLGDPVRHRYESATALATMLQLHRGTPYVYQGEELGMANAPFTEIGQYRDLETLNYYAQAVAAGRDPAELMAQFRAKSRDNARTPVQWDAGPGAGFTTGEPWIGINPDHVEVNAAAQVGVGGSVYEYYRELIALRHREPTLSLGSFEVLLSDDRDIYAYVRAHGDRRLAVLANLSGEERALEPGSVPGLGPDSTVLLGNIPGRAPADLLLPWEARVVTLS